MTEMEQKLKQAAKLAGRGEGSGETTVIGDVEQPPAPETAGVPQRPPPPPGAAADYDPNSDSPITVPTAISGSPPVASETAAIV